MKKKFIAAFLAFCMVLGMLPGTARAAEEVGSGKCGENLTWTLDDAGTLTISGAGEMYDYYFSTNPAPWYSPDSGISSVVIEGGVTSIGNHAFCKCSSLTNVTIPDGVTSIGNLAFYQCSGLTSVTIPESVTSIEMSAFSGCSSLTSITIPKNTTRIENFAFSGCSSLTNIIIPESVLSIGLQAFADCGRLTDITIPASVTSITGNVFYGCNNLKSISVSPDNPALSVVDNVLFDASQTELITYPNEKTDRAYVVPPSVTTVASFAFFGNSYLDSVTFLGDLPGIDRHTDSPGDTKLLFGCAAKLRYPYGNPTWTDEFFDDELEEEYQWDGTLFEVPVPVPYGPTTLTISTPAVSEDGSTCTLNVTSDNLPFDPDKGEDPANYTVSDGAYSVTAAAVDTTDDKVVTLTLGKSGGPAARASDSSIAVAAAAFAAELTDADNVGVAIASVSQSVQLPELTSPTEATTEPTEPSTETTEGSTEATEPSTETTEGSTEATEPSTDPTEVPANPPSSGTGSTRPSQPSTPSQPSKPVSVAVDDSLESGGPGEIVISGQGESDMQDIVKDGEFVNWIDRVDLPRYATDLYTVLCIGGNHDTLFDILISDEYQQLRAGSASGTKEEADVESVLELMTQLDTPYSSGTGLFQGDDFTGGFDTIDTTAGDRAISYGDLKEGDVVRTSAYNGIFITKIRKDGNANFEEDKKAASTYASTAFQAFDRDHPEIFWLSGKSKLRLVTVTMKDGSETYKETYIFFVLADADGFTVRDPLYPSQEAIEAAIARRDAAVETILSAVTAGTPNEQASQLNRWLTEHNHYNTSDDLYSLPNWPHECLSALEGNIGTDGPVCDGYSRAFKVLCDKLEIPCVLVDGYALTKAGGPGEFHMWNSVQIDGQWYGVDVTWNDPSVKGIDDAKSGHEREDFLLVGADTMVFGLKFSESHPPKNRAANGGVAFVNGPSLSTEAFNPLAGITVLPFTDVAAGSWYYSAVEYAYGHDLMTGETASAFAPDGFMTRAMVWTVLARMAGVDVNGGTPWYAPAQTWAVSTEVSDGSVPGGNISREELVTMLWRTQGCPEAAADLSWFSDSGAVSSWASGAVQWAVSTGLLEGSGGRIAPAGSATRAEAATLLMRFCGMLTA